MTGGWRSSGTLKRTLSGSPHWRGRTQSLRSLGSSFSGASLAAPMACAFAQADTAGRVGSAPPISLLVRRGAGRTPQRKLDASTCTRFRDGVRAGTVAPLTYQQSIEKQGWKSMRRPGEE
jgi:hypothetical protein